MDPRRRERRARPEGWWLDVAAALLVALTLVGTLQISPEDPAERPADAGALLLTVVAASAVLLVRRRPAATLVVALVVGLHQGLAYPSGPLLVVAPLTLALVGLSRGPRASVLAALALLLAGGAGHLLAGGFDPYTRAVVALGWLAAGVLAGEVLGAAADRAEERRRQAAREAEAARAGERLSVAQDLHDSVAHALSVIAIHARVAEAEATTDAGRTALAAITGTSTRAIADVSAIVHDLRGSAPTAPVTDLTQVAALVADARRVGQQVEVRGSRHGDPSSPVASAAYRVVQEGLTNARKHARGLPVILQLDGDDQRLTVELRNPLPPARTTSSTGLGVVGMTERVRATGGRLEAGPDEGAWVVRATW